MTERHHHVGYGDIDPDFLPFPGSAGRIVDGIGFTALGVGVDTVSENRTSHEKLLGAMQDDFAQRQDAYDELYGYAHEVSAEIMQKFTRAAHIIRSHVKEALHPKQGERLVTSHNKVEKTLGFNDLSLSDAIVQTAYNQAATSPTEEPRPSVAELICTFAQIAESSTTASHEFDMPYYEAAVGIVDAETRLWNTLGAALATRSDVYVFVDAIELQHDTPTDVDIQLRELLAIDLCNPNSGNRFDEVVQRAFDRDSSELDRDFLQTLLTNDTSTYAVQLRETASLFTDSTDEALARLHAVKDRWPQQLHAQLKTFKDTQISDIRIRTLRSVVHHHDETQKANDPGKGLQPLTDKLMHRTTTRPKQKRVLSATGTTKEMLLRARKEAIQPQPNTLRVISVDPDTGAILWDDDQSQLAAMKNRYIADQPQHFREALTADVDAILESVRAAEQKKGITPLRDVRLSKHARKVFRINPVYQPGLSTSTEIGKDTRVLFIRKPQEDGSIATGVIAILRHDDYLSWIKHHGG